VTGPTPMGPELVFHDPLSDSLAEQHAGSPDVPGLPFRGSRGNSISIRHGKTSVVDTGLRRATFHPGGLPGLPPSVCWRGRVQQLGQVERRP